MMSGAITIRSQKIGAARPCDRALRRPVHQLLALTVIALAIPKSLQASPTMLRALSLSGIAWQQVETMTMSGVAVHLRHFQSAQAPSVIAHDLATSSDYFQLAQAVPQGFSLSGVYQGWHWLAQISVDGNGSRGTVSILDARATTKTQSSTGLSQALPWLPQGSRLQFHHQTVALQTTIEQWLVNLPRTVSDIMANIQGALSRQGWVLEIGAGGGQLSRQWRRGEEVLWIFADTDGAQPRLLVQKGRP